MTCFLKLGMTLQQAIERVTIAPARALRMTDIAGSLKPGMPADITVFRVDSGAFTLTDTTNHTRRSTSASCRPSPSRMASGSTATSSAARTSGTG